MPTTAARLAAIEAALSPTQLVVRWLDEAHAYGSLDSYVRSLLDGPEDAYPLDRLLREARATVKGAGTGRGADPELRRVIRETAFRFELVIRINVVTHELLDREVLRHAALAAMSALLAVASPEERASERHRTSLQQSLAIADASVTELLASAEACQAVEARYLAGHRALFPDDVDRCDQQLAATQRQAVMAMRLAELDGLPSAELGGPDAVSTRAKELGADLVEPAKTTALEKLGDGHRALSIATSWLRGRLQTTAVAPG